jgi:hypothetical protein
MYCSFLYVWLQRTSSRGMQVKSSWCNMGMWKRLYTWNRWWGISVCSWSLLQRIPWTHDDSFGSIAQIYVDHVIKKYKDPVIVFDSYPELPSIKDVTHLRRTKGIVSPNINFTPTMPCKTKKNCSCQKVITSKRL